MANNFYQSNNEILKFNPYGSKSDLEKIQFDHYIRRKENLQRTKGELNRGLFKLSYATIIADTGLKRWKVQELIKWFEDNKIIECIEKSDSKGKESIYAYTSVYYAENELKNHTDFHTKNHTDNHTNLYSISNGLDSVDHTVNHTDNHTDFHTSKKEKEKEYEKENNIYRISSLAFTKIFNTWNDKEIVKHKMISDTMIKSYENISNTYSDSEIVEAIENYSNCLNDEKFYFTHKYTLDKFLQNGISNFVSDGSIYIDYLNHQSKMKANTSASPSTTLSSEVDPKYKDTCMYEGYKVKAKFYPRNKISYYDFENEYIDADNGTYEIPPSEVKRVRKIINERYTRGVEML